MTNPDQSQIDLLKELNDTSSTRNPGAGGKQLNLIGSRRHRKQQAQRRRRQQLQSHARFELRKQVLAEMRERPHCEQFNGRDFEQTMDAIAEAVRHVEKEGGYTKNYTFLIHPETLTDIQRLMDSFGRLNQLSVPSDDIQVYGISFFQSKTIPKGWLLACRKDYVLNNKGSMANARVIRSHPMALVQGINAGLHRQVPLTKGGVMNFRVIE